MRKRVGEPAKYRPKTAMLCHRMTSAGRKALDKGARQAGLSRGDYLEELVRRDQGLSTKGVDQ